MRLAPLFPIPVLHVSARPAAGNLLCQGAGYLTALGDFP